jgi:hypothetical protein
MGAGRVRGLPTDFPVPTLQVRDYPIVRAAAVVAPEQIRVFETNQEIAWTRVLLRYTPSVLSCPANFDVKQMIPIRPLEVFNPRN